jgi:hypothetical protein
MLLFLGLFIWMSLIMTSKIVIPCHSELLKLLFSGRNQKVLPIFGWSFSLRKDTANFFTNSIPLDHHDDFTTSGDPNVRSKQLCSIGTVLMMIETIPIYQWSVLLSWLSQGFQWFDPTKISQQKWGRHWVPRCVLGPLTSPDAGIHPQNVKRFFSARFCSCSYGFTTSRIRWRSETWRALWIIPWRIHGDGIYMLASRGYIDGIHVTIYSSTMDPMGMSESCPTEFPVNPLRPVTKTYRRRVFTGTHWVRWFSYSKWVIFHGYVNVRG